MFFHERDEVVGRVSGERGFCEMRIRGDEIFRRAMNVGEVAASSAGDEDFFADAVGALKDRDAAAALASFGGTEESCGAGAEDKDVRFVRWLRQAFNRPRGSKVCVRSFLRLN